MFFVEELLASNPQGSITPSQLSATGCSIGYSHMEAVFPAPNPRIQRSVVTRDTLARTSLGIKILSYFLETLMKYIVPQRFFGLSES
jgi:hypothetical protein